MNVSIFQKHLPSEISNLRLNQKVSLQFSFILHSRILHQFAGLWPLLLKEKLKNIFPILKTIHRRITSEVNRFNIYLFTECYIAQLKPGIFFLLSAMQIIINEIHRILKKMLLQCKHKNGTLNRYSWRGKSITNIWIKVYVH